MAKLNTEELEKLRKELHQHPELSGKEKSTAKRIKEYISEYQPSEIIENVGGHGLLAIYDSGEKGPHIAIRADIDALPIEEQNDFEYRSQNSGVSHKCGHDGHSAMLCGLAQLLHQQPPKKGKVCLLFQAAEETGEGSKAMIKDKHFLSFKADYIFGLHNLPGEAYHSIITSESHFAAASAGIIIKLTGATSHAAEPEKGKSPSLAVAKILENISLMHKRINFQSLAFGTVIHCKIGEIAFGTTPGYAEVMATLRAYREDDMNLLRNEVEKCAKNAGRKAELEVEISYTEEFPATKNNVECTSLVVQAAKKLGLTQKELDEPFRWSEDFGNYASVADTAFFGLGSGGETPNLHHAAYDFPDKLIPSGTKMFYEIIKLILNTKNA